MGETHIHTDRQERAAFAGGIINQSISQ